MSNKQNLSILGFYNYDDNIFNNLILPDNIDRDLVIENILMDNANISLIYTDYDFMKFAIGSWSKSEYLIWDRLNKAFNEEYNPLWNVDENTTETRTIEREGEDSATNTNTGTSTSATTDTLTGTTTNNASSSEHEENSNTENTSASGSGTNSDDNLQVNSIKGFNSDTWADHDKIKIDNANTTTTTNESETESEGQRDLTATNTNTETANRTNNINVNGSTTDNGTTEAQHSETVTETFNRRRGGNIGVTMSQQLLKAELDTRPEMNIYRYISNSFKKRFCAMVY